MRRNSLLSLIALVLAVLFARPLHAQPKAGAAAEPLPAKALARFGSLQFRHGSPIKYVAFSRDGKMAATGGDGAIRIWDMATGKQRRVIDTPQKAILTLTLSDDGNYLAALHELHERNHCLVWDARTGAEVLNIGELKLKTRYSIALSPDGKILAWAGKGSWDVPSHESRKALSTQIQAASSVAFSADGKQIALDGKETVSVWDLATAKEVASWKRLFSVESLAFSPDGKMLAVQGLGEVESNIRIYYLKDKKKIPLGVNEPGTFSSVHFSPDSKVLRDIHFKSPDEEGDFCDLQSWDLDQGEPLPKVTLKDVPFSTERVLPSLLSPDGKVIAFATDRLHLYDAASGKALFAEAGQDAAVISVAFPANGKTLIAASANSTKIWNLATGKVETNRRATGNQGLLTHDGKAVARWSVSTGALEEGAGQVVNLLDLASGKTKEFKGYPHIEVDCAAFSADGKVMAWGSRNSHLSRPGVESDGVRTSHLIRLWDTQTGQELVQSERRKVLTVWNDGAMPPGHYVVALAIAPDGQTLAALEDRVEDDVLSRRLTLWDMATLKRIRSFPKEELQSTLNPGMIRFSPDGKTIATVGEERTVTIWEPASGSRVLNFDNNSEVTSLAFSPSGRLLATGGEDGSIHFRDVWTGGVLGSVTGHRGAVRGLAFARDGKILASGGDDSTVLTWDIHDLIPAVRPAPRNEKELTHLWRRLQDVRGSEGMSAQAELLASGAQAVPVLLAQLEKIPVAQRSKPLEQLIQDLESKTFAVREQADQELQTRGMPAEALAIRTLANKSTSPETRRRLERMLVQFSSNTNEEPVAAPEKLAWLRALSVLERIGTPEALKALEKVAARGDQDPVAGEAKLAMDRLLARQK